MGPVYENNFFDGPTVTQGSNSLVCLKKKSNIRYWKQKEIDLDGVWIENVSKHFQFNKASSSLRLTFLYFNSY